MVMKTNMYETSDIALASYLFCSGTHLSEINRQNPRRCIFVFDFPNNFLLFSTYFPHVFQQTSHTASPFAPMMVIEPINARGR